MLTEPSTEDRQTGVPSESDPRPLNSSSILSVRVTASTAKRTNGYRNLAVRAYLYERVVALAMTDEDEPVQHCTLDEPVDIPAALEAAAIEYLDVDDQRTIVIYQHAILMAVRDRQRKHENLQSNSGKSRRTAFRATRMISSQHSSMNYWQPPI